MTHVYIDPDKIDWSSFLASQEGGGKYFVGTKYQRGYGIFSNTILPGIARFLVPIAKNFATSAGQQGIEAGTKILGDMSEGKDFKESLKEHSKQSLEKLADKLKQCGKGKSRRAKSNGSLQKPRKQYRDQLTFG
jgi:hypothetical protein